MASALGNGVKTIHIEPSTNFILVRFRRGTKLEIVNKLPASNAEALSAELKKMANLDSSKTTIPQYGLTKLEVAKKLHEFQIVTLPVIGGEKITIDVLDNATEGASLETIGLWGKALSSVGQALATNHGLILITSPGLKPAQDLLGLMLTTVVSPTHKMIYIGPIVSGIPLSVDIQNDDDLSRRLKALRVADYSIVALGLVGSSQVARQINDLVLMNQHVMAVLPASSVIQAAMVWQQMVNEPLSLSLVINQQTVAGLCDNCKQSYEPSVIEQVQLSTNFQVDKPDAMKDLHALEVSAIKAGLGTDDEPSSSPGKVLRLWRRDPHGCSQCNFSGYDKDIGIFEVLTPSDKFLGELARKTSSTKLQATAESDGLISLKTDALIKALRGLVDFKTVINICSTAN